MHSARHMVSDELKDKEVFIEFRNYHLEHKGKGGKDETLYLFAASLGKLEGSVEQIPFVPAHLPDQQVIDLPPKTMRKPRPTRIKDVDRVIASASHKVLQAGYHAHKADFIA